MEPSLVNPHSSVMVRYQDGERMGGVGWWGDDGGWKEIWPQGGGERERLIDADKPLFLLFPLLHSLGTQNTFPTFCSLKAFQGLICEVQRAAEWRPFSERLSLLETTRRGHYDSSERIKTPFVCLKLTHACLLCFWKAGAWETVHKYAFSSHWLPGHFVSLQTLFPFKCVFFSLVSLSPSCSPCPLLALPYANLFHWQKGWRKKDRPSKAQVRVNLGAVVFLLEGFRKMKTASVHRMLLSVTKDYQSLRLLTLTNKRRKRT